MIANPQIPGGTASSIVDILNGVINAIVPQVLALLSALPAPPI